MDDLERLRLARPDAIPPDLTPGGVLSFVGQVLSSGSNLGVGKFFLVRPVKVYGDEVEGTAGDGATVPDASGSVPVYLVGPGVPATGEHLVAKHVRYRWVAERMGGTPGDGGIGTIPSCACANGPTTISMVSSDPLVNFQTFQDSSMTWSPSGSTLFGVSGLSAGWYSDSMLLDPIASSYFFYKIRCLFNKFSLTQVYPTSPYGSPFEGGVIYTWLIGASGNSCSTILPGGTIVPGTFHLGNGTPAPGYGPVTVTID